ncbi:MAG: hypothetical protein KGO02_24470 [Alphaproteobacteria bacterium]|nr:hypothetical protein [Alphaproteobacteria bacterium]
MIGRFGLRTIEEAHDLAPKKLVAVLKGIVPGASGHRSAPGNGPFNSTKECTSSAAATRRNGGATQPSLTVLRNLRGPHRFTCPSPIAEEMVDIPDGKAPQATA